MITLRRIGVRSIARVAFLFGLATSFVNVVFAIFMIVVIQGVPLSVFPPEIWGQIAFNVTLSSLVMAVGVAVFALLYNMGFGGLELEFDMHDSPEPKHKNDHKEQVQIIEEDDIEEID